jgi:hypothetical protein
MQQTDETQAMLAVVPAMGAEFAGEGTQLRLRGEGLTAIRRGWVVDRLFMSQGVRGRFSGEGQQGTRVQRTETPSWGARILTAMLFVS